MRLSHLRNVARTGKQLPLSEIQNKSQKDQNYEP